MLVVKSIPAFNDNYIWLIHNTDGHCVVVDPGDAQPVIQHLNNHELILDAIFVTHHHNDHTGGVDLLSQHFPNTAVFGPSNSNIHSITNKVTEGDIVNVLDHEFSVMTLPGHTLDHIAFYNQQHLFCGDVLFSGGCGRVFEGTHEQMFHSLNKINALSENINIYPAHEYTLANLEFARVIEPNNSDLLNYTKLAKQLRDEHKPTLPTTLELERRINPFLRTDSMALIKSVKSRAKTTEALSIFSALREWKNAF